jgi:hypothetical protein
MNPTIKSVIIAASLSMAGCSAWLQEAPPTEFRDRTRATDRVSYGAGVDLEAGVQVGMAPEVDLTEDELATFLDRAEAMATPEGRQVLAKGRSLIQNRTLILGSCWDYIHGLYNQAGFPSKKRTQPFQSKKIGPYAALDEIQPGDWLYYVNRSYRGIEHSAVFVGWLDRSKNEALMISYAGGNRKVPARYQAYDLTQTYNMIRPKL